MPKLLESFSQVAGLLRPGSTIVLHSACAEPIGLSKMLADAALSLRDVTVLTLMPMGAAPYASPTFKDHLKVLTFFPGKGLRIAVNNGDARIIRVPLSEIPSQFSSGKVRANILFLQVSLPDEEGMVSLGVSVDYMPAVLAQKPLIVAEMSPGMPHTLGTCRLPLSDIDYVVTSGYGPQTVTPAEPDETDRRVALNVAALIDDGDVLQVGIGALPDRVLGELGHLKDLGIHSGIITDALRPLIEKGIVTNATKKSFQGMTVATMAAGTQSFYDFLNQNQTISFHPCTMTHNHQLLAGIEHLCAVNSVLQVDLAGNVNAETIGGKTVSAPGGLPDFAKGASYSPGGKSIMTLRAASKDGKQSNIVPKLLPTSPVTVEGAHVDYVVTEFGSAHIRGLTDEMRAKAIISIAHPDFRQDLEKELSAREK